MHKTACYEQGKHYSTVARAIGFIRANVERQPSLAEVAASVNLSEYHLQRIFTAWAGISPKRFLQYTTKERAKRALRGSSDLLDTTFKTGLSSPGRLHDLMVSCEAMTPGEIKLRGRGVTITYGVARTPFGDALIGWNPRGICYLAFCDNGGELKRQELAAQWPAATLRRDDGDASDLAEIMFTSASGPGKLHLLLRGTNFQIKVWEALLSIGPSRLVTYSQLASLSGAPGAQRAVGSALAANSIGFLIPCHRVIRNNGDMGNYRWGVNRKAAIQAWEASRNGGH